MAMFIGEALVGDGNEIAHIDLLIGDKAGPVGHAFATALANQSAGHNNLLAVLTPNLLCKPATVLITKVTIKGMTHAGQMFGPAQKGVAKDAGAAHVFSYGGGTPEVVRDLVHGCIFTRGPKDLHRTAVFVGGSDVTAGEKVLAELRKHLLPQYGLSVSVLLDSNGANTTAAAAVRAAGRHLDLSQADALVLGGTGPVGQRVARLLAKHGAHVRIGSRAKDRAEAVCAAIRKHVPNADLEAVAV